MTREKGDRRAQQRRRRQRYQGCRVCGIRGGCPECGRGAELVAVHGYATLALVVDGSYVPPAYTPGARMSGSGPSFAGAGLVLVKPAAGKLTGGKALGNKVQVLAEVACGFIADSSSDAEYQAVIRGARWAPGVTIYSDDRSIPAKLERVGLRDLDVRYLPHGGAGRGAVHDLAHLLSVRGRCRDAPSDGGAAVANAVAKAEKAIGLSKRQRRLLGTDILLAKAREDPAFDGNFVALAERLGWTSGRNWQRNPTIARAAKQWAEESDPVLLPGLIDERDDVAGRNDGT